jgi:hypothetical protein
VGNANRIGAKTTRDNILRSFISYTATQEAFFSWDTKSKMSPDLPSPRTTEPIKKEQQEETQGLPARDLKRLSDIVAMQPTTNAELASEWDLDSGKEVHRYLSSSLDSYFYRDELVRIRATEEAECLVES